MLLVVLQQGKSVAMALARFVALQARTQGRACVCVYVLESGISRVHVHVLSVKRLLLPALQQLARWSRALGPASAVHVVLGGRDMLWSCQWLLACIELFACFSACKSKPI
jgi:hypothetical protein